MTGNKDKRKGDKAIPDKVLNYLNEDQLAQLCTIERFGWELIYIRRPLFQDPVAVVINPNGRSIGVLDNDGSLNLDPCIETRQNKQAS